MTAPGIDPEIKYSPLCQVVVKDGVSLDVQIYEGDPGRWAVGYLRSSIPVAPPSSGTISSMMTRQPLPSSPEPSMRKAWRPLRNE